MLEYDMISVSKEIDVNNKNASKECNVCGIFLEKEFKFQPYVCNECHDLTLKAISLDYVETGFVKENDHKIRFCYMIKDEAVNL